MNETPFRSAAQAAELVRGKKISSRELTEALFARIEAVNPAVNAVVELRRETALREAAAADAAIGTAGLGLLHGVPMTVKKDSFNVAGLHTTWGNPEFKEYVADADATLVRRLRRAGAIVVGKTNVHFMLADFGQTANDLYGATHNPWDLTRTPGGSSGGGAAALAAGDASRRDGDSDGYGRPPWKQERLHRGASATARGRVPQDSPPRRRHHRDADWSELLQSHRQALDVCAVVRRGLWCIGQRGRTGLGERPRNGYSSALGSKPSMRVRISVANSGPGWL